MQCCVMLAMQYDANCFTLFKKQTDVFYQVYTKKKEKKQAKKTVFSHFHP